MGICRTKVPDQRQRDQQRDDEPAVMESDVDAEQPAQSHAWLHPPLNWCLAQAPPATLVVRQCGACTEAHTLTMLTVPTYARHHYHASATPG
jgi:hypothetical protein